MKWVLGTEPSPLKEQLLTAGLSLKPFMLILLLHLKGTGVVATVCDKCVIRLEKTSVAGT